MFRQPKKGPAVQMAERNSTKTSLRNSPISPKNTQKRMHQNCTFWKMAFKWLGNNQGVVQKQGCAPGTGAGVFAGCTVMMGGVGTPLVGRTETRRPPVRFWTVRRKWAVMAMSVAGQRGRHWGVGGNPLFETLLDPRTWQKRANSSQKQKRECPKKGPKK